MENQELAKVIKKSPLPVHIAIIMDGNGRWAEKRGLNRFLGHKAGSESLRRVVEEVRRLNIPYLTVFAFSTENWLRPKEEINLLMTLLGEYLDHETSNLVEKDIKLKFIGDYYKLNAALVKKIEQSLAKTSECKTMVLTIAMNYGGRQDICRAARLLAKQVELGKIKAADIDEKMFASRLYTADMPDPDLLLRTSGEQRISNFLLWQSAYTELIVSEIMWPDFNEDALLATIAEFQHRSRRFGGLKEKKE